MSESKDYSKMIYPLSSGDFGELSYLIKENERLSKELAEIAVRLFWFKMPDSYIPKPPSEAKE